MKKPMDSGPWAFVLVLQGFSGTKKNREVLDLAAVLSKK